MSGQPEKLKRITPTLQLVMNTGLTHIIEMLNKADVEAAFSSIKTLVATLREKDYTPLWEQCQALEKKLSQVQGGKYSDFHTHSLEITHGRLNILRANIRPLYRALTIRLHLGGYLERRDRVVPSNIPTALALEAES